MKRCELSIDLPAVVSDTFVCFFDANLRVPLSFRLFPRFTDVPTFSHDFNGLTVTFGKVSPGISYSCRGYSPTDPNIHFSLYADLCL